MPAWSDEEWAAIDRIFTEALELPEPERAEYVQRQANGRKAIRGEVEALLQAVDASDGFLSQRPTPLAAVALRDLAGEESHLPERVGDFAIDSFIGRGGMGTVYLAHRVGAAFEQKAALKILRKGLDTDDVVARFNAERRILAALEHPGIARLIDGGSTDDGRPWLAMEYVEGVPITEYCDRNRLTIEQRVRLMLAVIDAVEYAHRHLVVHRDLKPPNILVTAAGEVKLVDFGIAKIIDEDPAAPTPRTRTGVLLLTPEYASPEQYRGEAITTATDVYQLGVVLYELLTGRRPRPASGGSPAVATAIHRPSSSVTRDVDRATAASVASARATTPSGLQRRLRRDLDAILLTALSDEPERRYASARELSDDLRRHLEGWPVRARGDRWPYRLRKFAARHRGAVSAAAAAAVLVTSSLVMVSLKNADLVRERDRARLEESRARRTAELLRGIFTASDPNLTRGQELTARDLLDSGATKLRAELSTQPELRASLLRTIADVYVDLGLWDRAESVLGEVIAIRRQRGIDVSDDLRALAKLLERSEPQRSDRYYQAAIAEARRRHGSDPRLARILADYGAALNFRGSDGRALTAEALRILRGSNEDVRDQLAYTLQVHAYPEPPEIARAAMEEALTLLREVHGDEHLAVAAAMSDLALVLETLEPARSIELLEQSLAIYTKLSEPQHPISLRVRNNLAAVYREAGRYEEAAAHYRTLIALRRTHHADTPVELAYSLYGLGDVLRRQGNGVEAEPLLREALMRLSAGGIEQTDRRMLMARVALAETLMLSGKGEEAGREFEAAARDATGSEHEALQERIASGMAATSRASVSIARR